MNNENSTEMITFAVADRTRKNLLDWSSNELENKLEKM